MTKPTMYSRKTILDVDTFLRAPVRDPEWYTSPIDLPEGTSGTTQLRHRVIPAGEKVPIVGLRQGLMRGIAPVYAQLNAPLRVHELLDEDGIWMTDLPEELNQIAEMLAAVQPTGDVLVGGLGLGIVAATVRARGAVRSVTVIERSRDVVRLCGAAVPRRRGPTDIVPVSVVVDDIAAYLRGLRGIKRSPFDYYLLDTWRGTNELTWWEEVVPLRRLIRQQWGARPVIHCWAEDIMTAQVYRALVTHPPHWWMTYLPVPMSRAVAKRFIANVGLPAWERRYGAALDQYAAGTAVPGNIHT